jgi:hypothetical protein
MYAAVPGEGHHGGCRVTTAAMVRVWFISLAYTWLITYQVFAHSKTNKKPTNV